MLKKASFLFVTKSRKRRERQGESEWEELWEERAMSRSLRSSQLRAPKLWEGRQKWRRVGLPCSLIAKGPSSFNTLEVCKRLGFLHRNEVTVNYVSRLIPVYAAVIMDGLLRSPKKGPVFCLDLRSVRPSLFFVYSLRHPITNVMTQHWRVLPLSTPASLV